jgi:hypothetical protein
MAPQSHCLSITVREMGSFLSVPALRDSGMTP